MGLENGKSLKSIDITFQLTAEAKSPYWSLLKYYQSATKEKVRQMFFEAVMGYWGAIARSQLEGYRDTNTLRQAVLEAIYSLEQHIYALRTQFEIDSDEKNWQVARSFPSSERTMEPINLVLRYQVQSTWQVLLTQYLINETAQFKTSQKILWANLAYWKAIVERELEIFSPEQLSWSANYCVLSLRKHIEFLKTYFELDLMKTTQKIVCPWGMGISNYLPKIAGASVSSQYEMVSSSDELKPASSLEEEATEAEIDPKQFLKGNPEDDELMRNLFENL